MGKSFLIRNAFIVNEGKCFNGAVLIQGSLISEIFVGSPPQEFVFPPEIVDLDAGGKYLVPGIIDDQVHFRDPGLTSKGDLLSESRAAIAGGVTSFMDMPNTNPRATTLDILEEKYRLGSEKSLANYSFFLGATNDNMGEIIQANPAKICGLKVFLGASTGEMLVDNQDSLERIFTKSPLLIAVHAEEESVVQKNLKEYTAIHGENIPVNAHPMIRSDEACYLSSLKAVTLARKFGSRLHLLHLSTARELELLDSGIPLVEKSVTGEVCVHHLWFDNRDYTELGSLIKWNPAIKTENDKLKLFEGVLSGKIDIIATDHAPHTWQEKQNPYASCPSGAPFIQHSLVAMLSFFHLGKISLELIVEKMCHAPAVLYRINKRGFIRKGYYADLVLFDPDNPWMVEKENILYKCGWSPLEGVTFRSRVTHTWVNGNLVFNQGRIDESIKGMRLEFNY